MRDLNYQLKLLCKHSHEGSFETRVGRERQLSAIANQLHDLGFRQLKATSLKQKHVKALVEHWLEQKLSPGTIKNRMSCLRWWAEKVNKRAVVAGSNDFYGIPARQFVSEQSKAKDLAQEQLAQVKDEHVRMSLRLQQAFGLRREEALKIQPRWADRGRHLHLKASWTKGGRERTVPIRTIEQRALLVVRRILTLAARLWRDESGLTWLETAPLLQMLDCDDARKPYPLSWDEQARLFARLPEHLREMALFKVNTGTREQEVTCLQWSWEVSIPELKTSVFVVPGNGVENGEDRLVVMNAEARAVINCQRGKSSDYVFTYSKGKPVDRINTKAWRRAREEAGLPHVRVHDLKHTFGRRLRAKGVSHDTRQVLLGHKNGQITTHYAAAEIGELIDAVDKVSWSGSSAPTLTLIKNENSRKSPAVGRRENVKLV